MCLRRREDPKLATPHATFLPAGVPAHGRFAVYVPAEPDPAASESGSGALVEAARRWGLEGGERGTVRVAVPTSDGLTVADVAALTFGVADVVPALLRLRWSGPVWASPVPSTVRVWALATHLALRLAAAHRLVPALVSPVDGDAPDGPLGVWRVAAAGDDDAVAAVTALARSLPPAGHAATVADDRIWDPSTLVQAFLDAVADDLVRRATTDPSPSRPRARILPWTARWSAAVTDRHDAVVPLRDDASELLAGVASWLDALDGPQGSAVAELRLRAPGDPEGSWRLEFGVRTDDGVFVPAARVWSPAADDSAESAEVLQPALLTGLARCARLFPPLEAVLDEPDPEGADLLLADAWRFIDEVAPLVDGQVVVRLPDEIVEGDLRIRLRVGREARGVADAPDAPDGREMPDTAVDGSPLAGEEEAAWEVALGDDVLDDAAVGELLAASAPLVHWRGRWVRVDPEVAGHLEQLGPPRLLPFAEAVGLALAGSADFGTQAPFGPVEVVSTGRVDELVGRIRQAAGRPSMHDQPDGFVGDLRAYQRRGVAWLGGMAEIGLGGVLADDMGLGKTVQLIAHLLTRPTGRPHLIVCPTSVVGNWEREIGRFAPGLRVARHHGAERQSEPYAGNVVVVTSYGTLRRDVDQLAATDWDVVTLDEAQFVKNPVTAGARAVRRLRAAQRVAMTGTPLENRLLELWSLIDATNTGLLGSRAAFQRRYVTPVEAHRDRGAARRLRQLVAPFVLRREKSDPDVAAQLPDKIERTVVCPLTSEQAQAYTAAVDRALAELSDLGGMHRRGRVLSLLTELKQICNHPAQREGAGAGDLTGRSGKFETARAIVAEAVEAGDQVLVFSQYVKMTELLSRQLADDLGVDVPVLHGGLAAGARDRMVAAFQGELGEAPPVLVVSLRAGGTGLNLTAASQVLHFDRWWNPAVEDQATDRAHRIGQLSTVEVHKLVTSGTVEERIADLLEHKRQLADAVVGAGEAWITELSDGELAELVALGRDSEILDFDDDLDGAEARDALLGVAG